MVEKRLRTVFMGTPDFAVYGLRAMVEAEFIPEAVVTQPDRPKGRGMALTPPPVKEFCLRKGMNFLQPEDPSSPEFIKILGALDLDLIVVIAYGHILKPELLSLPKMGCLNIHASLLPQLRGPAPIQWAIINGLKETGLTAMWMDRGVDTGNILAQEKVGITPNDTFGSLYEKLAQISGPFLVRILHQLSINGYNPGSPQNHSIATFAPKITKDMRRIHWRRPAEDLARLIRALDPFPGAYCLHKGKEIRLFRASSKNMGMDVEPGRVIMARGPNLLIGTGNGILSLEEAQLSGKRRLPVSEFLKGYKIQEGEYLE